MTHRVGNIPWDDVIRIVRPEFRDGQGISQIVPCVSEDVQLAKMQEFIAKFVQTLKHEADLEREMYPKSLVPADEDETVISEAVAARILPTIEEYSGYNGVRGIPIHTRKMHAFTDPEEDPDMENKILWQYYHIGYATDFQLDLIKAMLIHGQVEPVLRICGHPSIDAWHWHCFSLTDLEWSSSDGWDQLYIHALEHYMLFNLLHCLIDIWPAEMQGNDYRDLKAFQMTWYTVSRVLGMSGMCSSLERHFLGMPDGRDASKASKTFDRITTGQLPFIEFVKACAHIPEITVTPSETIHLARSLLQEKRLPKELQDYIIMLTGKEDAVDSILNVPYDPLHPDNKELLHRQMERYWKLLVHCQLLSEVADVAESIYPPETIDWGKQIGMNLWRFLGLGPVPKCD